MENLFRAWTYCSFYLKSVLFFPESFGFSLEPATFFTSRTYTVAPHIAFMVRYAALTHATGLSQLI